SAERWRGVCAFSRRRLHPDRSRRGGARLSTAASVSANIGERVSRCDRPAGGCAHPGTPSGEFRIRTLLASFVRYLYLMLACLVALAASQKPAPHALHARIPMRDGIRLAANVYLPTEHGRFLVILERTLYNKGTEISANYEALVEHGYAVVVE